MVLYLVSVDVPQVLTLLSCALLKRERLARQQRFSVDKLPPVNWLMHVHHWCSAWRLGTLEVSEVFGG